MSREDRSKVIGRLETLVALEGHTITINRSMMILFEDCIELLGLMGREGYDLEKIAEARYKALEVPDQ